MIRSITKNITAGAGAEVLETILTGQDGKTQHLQSMSVEVNDGVFFRLYLDQDRIVEVGGACDSLANQLIPVDTNVKTGETVKVGIENPSGGSVTAMITLFYTED